MTLMSPAPPGAAAVQLPTAFRIAAIEQDNYRTKTFIFEGELDAIPGQFVMAWLPRFDEKPFSLVSASPIRLMITAVGPFTRLVHQLSVGERLWLRGPYGRGFALAENAQRIALVAGGYGVAPLFWLAQTALPHVQSLDVFLGARQAIDLLYASRFAVCLEASRQDSHNGSGLKVNTLHLTTDDGSHGLHGRVTHALAPLLEAGSIDAVYACGPDAMLQAVNALCTQFKLPAQLSWEAYMRCGVGLCGSCEHHGALLCMDGPVLPRL